MKKLVGLLVLVSSALYAYDWSGVLLNNNKSPADCDVIKDGDGKIVVYGTEGAWGGGHTKEQMFDGIGDGNANFFDPPQAAALQGNCWAGIGFTKPKLALRIRFLTRDKYDYRAEGCYIQGANNVDFSDAVTIHVVAPTTVSRNYNEQWLSYPNTEYRAYRYFRILGPTPHSNSNPSASMAGNLSELEFYGIDAEDWPSIAEAPAPRMPEVALRARFNGKMNFRAFSNAGETIAFEVQCRRAGEKEYSWAGAFAGHNGWVAGFVDDPFPGEVQYRLRARNPNGVGRWVGGWTFRGNYPQLGSYIGTSSCFDAYKQEYGTKVFDGNVFNYADASTADAKANTVCFGQSLAAEALITSFRYVCRDNSQGAMDGAYFQVADDAAFTQNVQTIYTIPSRPAEYTEVTAVLDTPVTARYIRYHAATGRYGNAAEIEFSSQITATPAGLAATYDGHATTLTWGAYAGNDPRVVETRVYRRRMGELDWTLIGTVAPSETSFVDTKTAWQPVFAYTVAFAGQEIEGGKAPYVVAGAIQQLERDPGDQTKLREGVNVVWRGYPYKTDNTAAMALKVFDGNESTCCDLATTTQWNTGVDVALGVDFGAGKGFALASAKLVARPNFPSRINGSVLYGSNSATGDWYNDAEEISEPILVDAANMRCEVLGTSTNTYRYIFLRQPDNRMEFWGNVMEMQLFGLKPSRCPCVVIIR